MNAISIDMDYIMKPVINLYNDISKADNPDRVWDTINRVRNIDEFAKIDENNFKLIIKTVSKVLSKYNIDKTKIVFAEHHDFILEELTKYSNLRVINIDHHHDINYSPEHVRDVDQFDFATVANWVWYLDKYNLIDEYIWIKNNNSAKYEGPPMEGQFKEFVEPADIDFEIIGDKVDLLFICKSRGWIPPKFHIYFDYIYELICTFLNKKLEIYKENYCVGGLPRKCETDARNLKKTENKRKIFC